MKKSNVLIFFIRLLQGTLIGVGAVLPGISGGVLATVFGIYEPLMEILAHPLKNLKKHISLIIPVFIGIAVGFVGLAKLVKTLYNYNEKLAICIFIGLIIGTLPALWGKASVYGHGGPPLMCLAAAFAVTLTLLFLLKFGTNLILEPNIFWFCVCGVLLALGMIVPGLTAPSIMIFLGLYEPLLGLITGVAENIIGFVGGEISFSYAIHSMRLTECVMFALGFLGAIALVAKPVNILLKRFPGHMYHIIFGIVVATLIPLIPSNFASTVDAVVCLAGVIGGFLFAFFLDFASRKLIEKQNSENNTEETVL